MVQGDFEDNRSIDNAMEGSGSKRLSHEYLIMLRVAQGFFSLTHRYMKKSTILSLQFVGVSRAFLVTAAGDDKQADRETGAFNPPRKDSSLVHENALPIKTACVIHACTHHQYQHHPLCLQIQPRRQQYPQQ